MGQFEVRQDTICNGWVNNWLVGNDKQVFESVPEAQEELDEHLNDLLLDSEFLEDETPNGEEYRIYDLITSEYVA